MHGHVFLMYFFEVNTKYISSIDLKTSKFSRVRSTNENLDQCFINMMKYNMFIELLHDVLINVYKTHLTHYKLILIIQKQNH